MFSRNLDLSGVDAVCSVVNRYYDQSPDAPAPGNVNPNPVPEFIAEDDDEISNEGRAEDQADANVLDDKDVK